MRYGIKISGYIQTDTIKEPKVSGRLLSREELFSEYEKYILIKGYIEQYMIDDDVFMRDWRGCKAVFEVTDIDELNGVIEEMPVEYYQKNINSFIDIKESVSDALSAASLDAFLQLKVFGDITYIRKVIAKEQYFLEDAPWEYNDDDVFVDCGAFDGDTVSDYVLKSDGHYSSIIAVEPDDTNYAKLLMRIEANNIERIRCINKGVDCISGTTAFESDGSVRSSIKDNGNKLIEIDTIDQICSDTQVSIIKMDIEGKEIDAIKGAKNTIKRDRPILMICAYHKCDDIISIFKLVNEYVSDYDVYFRCHRPTPIEAVYYFVPKERNKGGNKQ